MSIRSISLLALPLVFMASAAGALAAEPAPGKSESARLATYQKPSGETFFALSLQPQAAAEPAQACDIVVLFDTSASQTGAYRTDSLEALKSMLRSLDKNDRVQLLAVDLNAVALTSDFVSPTGTEMKAAIKKLEQRVPLGSTDMAGALDSAANCFAGKGTTARAVVYMGDAMCRGNLVDTKEFAALMQGLVSRRVAVSSYAMGPSRNVPLLAAVANHTGGQVYVPPSDGHSAQQAGAKLARVAREIVIWPTAVTLPEAMTEVFPRTVPPLRADRDTPRSGAVRTRSP